MGTILVTSTYERIGSSVLQQLLARYGDELCIVSGTPRHAEVGPDCRYFDWAHPKQSAETLREVDCVFLMQPASLSGIPNRFSTLLNAVPEGELPHLVYISIMGAERHSAVSSHFRVENLIRRRAEKEIDTPFTILRPSYLMQNLRGLWLSYPREMPTGGSFWRSSIRLDRRRGCGRSCCGGVGVSGYARWTSLCAHW